MPAYRSFAGTLVVGALLLLTASAWDVAKTPPMGFNTWNLYGCGVSAQLLMDTADAMVASGLRDVGYEFVNSDDCWMLAERNAAGQQVADPAKFPNGFAAVTAYIHSKGMKSGLYTAKGNYTCQRRAASCMHEVIDANQWASWGIDYVKDDSCSQCFNYTDNEDYRRMWLAIQNSSRPMVLTLEANPTDSIITKGGYGNAKRVGHDIAPFFQSMISLVDIGSGLWPYAHNATNAEFGGWWNDLDMIEIGNGPDFVCSDSPAALARCQYHFSMWTAMKAVLLLGNDISAMDNVTKSVVANTLAISVNQDPLGVQAKRVSVFIPKNQTLVPSANFAVLRTCASDVNTQTWTLTESNATSSDQYLYIEPCQANVTRQMWRFDFYGGKLLNIGTDLCVDPYDSMDPVSLRKCATGTNPRQTWTLDTASQHVINPSTGNCLDVYDFTGPDVQSYPCKAQGDDDGNQRWTFVADGSRLESGSQPGMCLAAMPHAAGGLLSTVDPTTGQRVCLTSAAYEFFQVTPCPDPSNAKGYYFQFKDSTTGGSCTAASATCTFGPGWNNKPGASGPWQSSRYLEYSGGTFVVNATALASPAGSTIMASDTTGILNDNLVGTVTTGGKFCLDAVPLGMLEVWATPLVGGRIAVIAANRSPGTDILIIDWAAIGAPSETSTYTVVDVWTGQTVGSFAGSWPVSVDDLALRYFIFSPK